MDYIKAFLNKVIEGDCLDIMHSLPNESIDLILCDLPYGTTQNPWDNVIDFSRLWPLYERIIKPNGVIALTGTAVFTAKLIMSILKKQSLRRHEDICIFYRSQPPYNPQMLPGAPYNRGWRRESHTGSYGKYKPSPITSNGGRYPCDIVLFDEELTDDWFYCQTAEN